MNQMLFLMLGLAGLAGLGALMSSNDDNEPPEDPEDPYGDREIIEGTRDEDVDDTITGSDADEAILAYDGDDLVDGGAGDDRIWTGYGNDTVAAAAGNDLVYLGGDDDLYGAYNPGFDEGQDTISGGSGRDVIITNGGTHEIYGDGNPNDVNDNDDDYGSNDSIYDNGGTVYVEGGYGDDLIWSPDASDPEAPDTLLGGEGADTIYAGAYDIVDGERGSDVYILDGTAGGPADITWGSNDRIQVLLPDGYEGEGEVAFEQDGDDVVMTVDGNQIAVLRDVDVSDVRHTIISEDDLPVPPWVEGS